MPGETASATVPMPTVPLVLGVTGHCDLSSADVLELRKGVVNILRQVKDHCPHEPTIEVLSCLAEGADQLVAEVALQAGCSVRAPLPFPPEVYKKSTSFWTD